MKKSSIKTTILLPLFLLLSNHSYADQYLDLIRVTCIPEIPHFTVERENSHDGVDFLLRSESEGKDSNWSKKVLEKHGLLLADKFDYECKLPNGTFRIWGNTPSREARGMCGGNPRTVISMSKNGEKIIDQVFFESSCLDEENSPYIGKIDIEGSAIGWGTEEFITSIETKTEGSPNKKPISFWRFKPRINQEYINCVVSEVSNGKNSDEYEAKNVCNKKIKYVSEALIN